MNQFSRLFAPHEGRDLLRGGAGLLIGIGLLMAWLRKGSDFLGSPWGDWGLFLVLLLAFLFLYGVGMLGRLSVGGYRPWAGVYLTFGVIIAPFLLAQFVQAVNGNSGADLNVFWIFLVTAGLAVAAAFLAGVRYALLLASLALIVSWSVLWDRILSGGLVAHLGVYRGLLLVLAALLVGGAFVIALLDPAPAEAPAPGRWGRWAAVPVRPPASDVITGAAVAALIAGAFSFTRLAAFGNPFVTFPTADSSFFWELVLLAVSLLAIAYGAWAGVRGPAYVGGVGLFSFLLIAGFDLNDTTPEGSIAGWPLALVLIGALAFAGSLLAGGVPRAGGFGRGAGATPPPPAPGEPPPTPPPPGGPGSHPPP